MLNYIKHNISYTLVFSLNLKYIAWFPLSLRKILEITKWSIIWISYSFHHLSNILWTDLFLHKPSFLKSLLKETTKWIKSESVTAKLSRSFFSGKGMDDRSFFRNSRLAMQNSNAYYAIVCNWKWFNDIFETYLYMKRRKHFLK